MGETKYEWWIFHSGKTTNDGPNGVRWCRQGLYGASLLGWRKGGGMDREIARTIPAFEKARVSGLGLRGVSHQARESLLVNRPTNNSRRA